MNIPDEDIKRQTYKASGKGGQRRNKVETAVRLTHIPTGIVAECCDERYQGKNETIAYERLVIKLENIAQARRDKIKQDRYEAKPETSFGSQIRTYRLCGDKRTIDHRTGKQADTKKVLNGNIDCLR